MDKPILSAEFKIQNKLTSRAKNIAVAYRKLMLKELAEYLNKVRKNSADEQIIPRIDTKERRPYYLAKLQPSTPGRLTTRTGALVKMLKDIGAWTSVGNSTRIMRSNSGAVQGVVKVTTRAIIEDETYEATLSANIKSESKYTKAQKGNVKQKLFMRFRWETGIRGQKRPFIAPAGEKIYSSTEKIIQAKTIQLNSIRGTA